VNVDPPDLVYPTGTIVTLRALESVRGASPPTNVLFVEWLGACSRFGTNKVCNLEMDTDKDVTAVFEVVRGELIP